MAIVRNVLIVEDEEILREIFKDIFEDMSFEVYEAANGYEAISCLENNKLELIISDIRMPECTGIEMLEIIKEKNFVEIPVILMTGYSDYKIEKLKTMGVKEVFYKPINPSELMSYILEEFEWQEVA